LLAVVAVVEQVLEAAAVQADTETPLLVKQLVVVVLLKANFHLSQVHIRWLLVLVALVGLVLTVRLEATLFFLALLLLVVVLVVMVVVVLHRLVVAVVLVEVLEVQTHQETLVVLPLAVKVLLVVMEATMVHLVFLVLVVVVLGLLPPMCRQQAEQQEALGFLRQ
jgi:hypothetical protein